MVAAAPMDTLNAGSAKLLRELRMPVARPAIPVKITLGMRMRNSSTALPAVEAGKPKPNRSG